MKRSVFRLLSLVLALALALTLLSACGEKEPNDPPAEPNSQEQEVPEALEENPEEEEPPVEDIPRVPENSTPLEPYEQLCMVYTDFWFTFAPYIIGENLYTPEDIRTYRYESYAIFEGSEELAEQIMEDGKNPGLGVRGLHEQGITGEGVNVAIIDQNLLLDHPEYKGRVAAYYDSGCEDPDGSMHAPAVLSILAGKEIGVAPGAKVYFAAAPSWKMDSAYFADCLYWIIEQNAALPEGEKIRVVSVSGAPEGETEEDGWFINGSQWTAAVAAAEEAGMLVIDCRSAEFETGFVSAAYCPEGSSEDVRDYVAGYPSVDDSYDAFFKASPEQKEKFIFAPTSYRTTAQEYIEGDYIYTYWGQGGQSWAVPYVAGVLALGWQVNPDLDGQTMKDLLFESAYVNENGNHMIDPPAFVELVRATVE